MAEEYYSILTTIGQGKIASAVAAGTKVTLTHFALGNGGGASYSPTESQTALKREVYRANVSSVAVADETINMIEINMNVPADVGGWTVREMGVFDDAGDLIAIAKTPDDPKPAPESGAAKDVIYRMFILVANADTVEIKIDPNVRLATKDELEAVKINLQGQIDTMSAELSDSITEVSGQIGQNTDTASAKTLFGGQAGMKNSLSTIDSRVNSTYNKVNTMEDTLDRVEYKETLQRYYNKYEYFFASSEKANSVCFNNSGDAANGQRFYIVGKAGLLKRQKYDKTNPAWETLTSNTTADLTDIIYLEDQNKMIACGNGTTNNIIVSVDGGGTWTAKTLPSTPGTNGEFVFHSPSGILLLYYKNSQTYFRSVNFGDTWTSHSFPSGCTPYSLCYHRSYSYTEGSNIFLLGTNFTEPVKMSADGIAWITATSNKVDLTKIRIESMTVLSDGILATTPGNLPTETIPIDDSYIIFDLGASDIVRGIYCFSEKLFRSNFSVIGACLLKGRGRYDYMNDAFLALTSGYSDSSGCYRFVEEITSYHNPGWQEMGNGIPISSRFKSIAYGSNIMYAAGSESLYGFNAHEYLLQTPELTPAEKYDALKEKRGKFILAQRKRTDEVSALFVVPTGVHSLYIEACGPGEDATTTVSGDGGSCFSGTIDVEPGIEIEITIDSYGAKIQNSDINCRITASGGYGAAPGESSIFATGGGRFNMAGGGGGYGGGGAPGINAATMISLPGDGKGGPGGLPGCGGVGNPIVVDGSAVSMYNGGNGAYGAGGGAPYNSSYKPGKGGPGIVVIYY